MKKSPYLRNTFGVEFEFIDAPLRDVRRELRKLKLRDKVTFSNGWSKSNGKCWHIKVDSTTTETDYDDKKDREIHYGGEVASPILTPSKITFKELEMVYTTLINVGSNFNDECGLHIHIDISNLDRFKVLLNLLKNEHKIYKGFEYRKKCEFAKPLKRLTTLQMKKKIKDKLGELLYKKYITRIALEDHYANYSFYKRKKKNMLEVRVGCCTPDIKKTLDWIKLILSIVKEAKDMDIIEEIVDDE